MQSGGQNGNGGWGRKAKPPFEGVVAERELRRQFDHSSLEIVLEGLVRKTKGGFDNSLALCLIAADADMNNVITALKHGMN